MKHIKMFLLTSMVMFFTTYSNANTVNMAPIISYLLSNTQAAPPVEPGDGSAENPFAVSNGIHSYTTYAYFTFKPNSDNCNVLIYDAVNSYYRTLYDNTYDELVPEDDLKSYVNLNSSDYILKASSWQNNTRESKVGIYSPCMNSTNYTPDNVKVGLNTFSVDETNHLYKFHISNTSTVTINRVEGSDYVYLYNATMNNIYKGYGDTHVNVLEPGAYYLLVNKYAYNTSNDVVFSFAIDEI